MTTLTIDLPDELAKAAQDAGLLDRDSIAAMLRENLRRQGVDELFQAMDRMGTVDTPPVMSPEEITEELRRMRAESRSQNAR
ncbi:MAG: hypothetical protein U5S82_13085 [Gammaproteobacteria bacterium]|nr:hypothetical protein [Gammaproteobacteria bacterium]MDZ7752570.1 hypothetical protein [Gammaproteobacteria bacterium]